MWKFIKSSSSIDNWHIHNNIEICFIGRSNVGKSSLINALANNKKLAKTSKMPGRTQLINYFLTEKNLVVVDLPGYGYANISQSKQEAMFKMIDDYFLKSRPKFVFILIDSRRGILEKDQEIISHLKSLNHEIIFVLTKTDKCTQKELSQSLKSELIRNHKYFLSSITDQKKISTIKNFLDNIS